MKRLLTIVGCLLFMHQVEAGSQLTERDKAGLLGEYQNDRKAVSISSSTEGGLILAVEDSDLIGI